MSTHDRTSTFHLWAQRRPFRAALGGALGVLLLSAAACDGCNPTPEPTPDAAACTAGTQGCACNAGQCNAGLECRDAVCQPVVLQIGLVVSSPEARACEVLLEHATGVQARFGAALKGKAIPEGERVALAFTAAADAPIAAGDVQLAMATGASGSLSTVSVLSSRCFGTNGALLAGASVSLNLGQ